MGALFIATAIPLFFLYLVHALDLYSTGSFRAIVVSFLWGGIAVAAAVGMQQMLLPWFPGDSLVLVAAPVMEETLKALLLLYLIRRPTFTYFVDGAIYGFAAGVGFAVFENYVYIGQNIDAGMSTALGRVLSTNLMHASASAIVGIVLGIARVRRFSRRIFYLLCGLALAVLLHVGFNYLVIRSTSQLLFFYATIGGVTGFAFIAFIIKRGLAAEKRWIEEKLGAADRVTAAEAAVVHRLEQLDALLNPLAEIFGRDKTAQIERFLVLQARLGILRKTLDRVQGNERMGATVEQQIEEIRTEMDAARRAVGTYTMASLRTLFPNEQNPMWQRLQSVLQEKQAPQTGNEGLDLFTLADVRMRERETPPEE